MNGGIDRNNIETLFENRFLKVYDLRYAEGKHYFEASRRGAGDLVVRKEGEDFRGMLPDAVTIAVVLHLPGDQTRLLMSYEYRYPVGQFLLSPVAGLLDPEDRNSPDPLVTAAVREIREELNAAITVGDLLITVECDYPKFHLSMDCFWATLCPGSEMSLLEHEAAKWLTVDELDSVDWLPADIEVVNAIRKAELK